MDRKRKSNFLEDEITLMVEEIKARLFGGQKLTKPNTQSVLWLMSHMVFAEKCINTTLKFQKDTISYPSLKIPEHRTSLTAGKSILSVCALEASSFHIVLVYAEYWTRTGFQTIYDHKIRAQRKFVQWMWKQSCVSAQSSDRIKKNASLTRGGL